MIHIMEAPKSFRIDVLILHPQYRPWHLHKYRASLAAFHGSHGFLPTCHPPSPHHKTPFKVHRYLVNHDFQPLKRGTTRHSPNRRKHLLPQPRPLHPPRRNPTIHHPSFEFGLEQVANMEQSEAGRRFPPSQGHPNILPHPRPHPPAPPLPRHNPLNPQRSHVRTPPPRSARPRSHSGRRTCHRPHRPSHPCEVWEYASELFAPQSRS